VVLSFSRKNTYYRRIECEVGAKYGVRSCSGDTIGPAGIFHAVREFPAILEITHAVEELCPEAWVINYVNPAATMGIGLMRHTKAKCIALCDVHHMPRKKQSYLALGPFFIKCLCRKKLRVQKGKPRATWKVPRGSKSRFLTL
jgi:alpha-galactosidase